MFYRYWCPFFNDGQELSKCTTEKELEDLLTRFTGGYSGIPSASNCFIMQLDLKEGVDQIIDRATELGFINIIDKAKISRLSIVKTIKEILE